MDRVELAGTGKQATRLGFGGSGLMGGLSRRESLALLEAAFAAGIRHYDTAPMYGHGESERCLGDFLRGRRSEVTVTTKYGIPPPSKSSWKYRAISATRGLVRPIMKAAPGLKRSLQRTVSGGASPTRARAAFSGDEARRSLETSLLALGTDHIDLWLLHEAEADDLTDPSLLEEMQRCMAEGKIGAFGVGSSGSKIPRLYQERPEYCRVMQFEWTIDSPRLGYPGSFRLHHGSLSGVLGRLSARLAADQEQANRWSDATGTDLRSADLLARLLLKAALELNSESLILFFSRRQRNIEAAAATEADSSLTPAALRLWEIVRTEVSAAHNNRHGETHLDGLP
jgi:D-threo-aldose 1-dehydrogenase